MKVAISNCLYAARIYYEVDYDKFPEDKATITVKTVLKFKVGKTEMVKDVSNTVVVDNEEIMNAIRAQHAFSEIHDYVKRGIVGRHFELKE